jgi:hypothetical protein
MVFNATFNNISVISWLSVLLVEEKQRPAVSHWQTLSHNNVSSTRRLSGIRTHNVIGDTYSNRLVSFFVKHCIINSSCICSLSININKSNNYLSPQLIEHKKENDIWRWTSSSWLEIGRICGRLKACKIKQMIKTIFQLFFFVVVKDIQAVRIAFFLY